MPNRTADRAGFFSTLWLVVGREFRTRTFSRAALLSLGFSVLIIAGLVFVPKIIGSDGAKPEVTVVGASAAQVEQFRSLVPDHRIVEGQEGTRPSEEKPFVLTLDNGAITSQAWKSSELPDLEVVTGRVQLALTDGSIPAVQLSAVNDDSSDVQRAVIGYFMIVMLFGQIVGMSSAVTQALMEEKGNRVIDLLLPKIKPLALLWGKVIGAGAAGLVQLAAIAAAAMLLLLAGGDSATLGIVAGIGWVVLLWYALGFLFMGVIYGGVGALMRKPDDVPVVTVPLQLLNMLTFLVGVVGLQMPGAAWVDIVSKVPPFSAILVPLQVITRQTTAVDVIISAGVTLTCAALLSLAGARLFSLGVRTDSPGEALRHFTRRLRSA